MNLKEKQKLKRKVKEKAWLHCALGPAAQHSSPAQLTPSIVFPVHGARWTPSMRPCRGYDAWRPSTPPRHPTRSSSTPLSNPSPTHPLASPLFLFPRPTLPSTCVARSHGHLPPHDARACSGGPPSSSTSSAPASLDRDVAAPSPASIPSAEAASAPPWLHSTATSRPPRARLPLNVSPAYLPAFSRARIRARALAAASVAPPPPDVVPTIDSDCAQPHIRRALFPYSPRAPARMWARPLLRPCLPTCSVRRSLMPATTALIARPHHPAACRCSTPPPRCRPPRPELRLRGLLATPARLGRLLPRRGCARDRDHPRPKPRRSPPLAPLPPGRCRRRLPSRPRVGRGFYYACPTGFPPVLISGANPPPPKLSP